jgi:ferredoxin-NADP reductase
VAAPWILGSTAGITLGLILHAAWFGICEQRFHRAPPSHETPSAAARASRPATSQQRHGNARPSGFIPLPVLAVLPETADITTFRLARPDTFAFNAGQFIAVRVRVDGQSFVRCYSISSAPHATGYLEISVKRQGLVSGALHATLRPGASLFVKAPNGAFVYPAADDRPLVLVAGGVGITPLMSMLRHAVQADPGRPVTLLYGVHTEHDIAFRDELVSIGLRHPQVRVHVAASVACDRPEIYPGRIDGQLIRATVPDPRGSIFCMCGPDALLQSVKSMLTSAGVPPAQIRYEIFQPTVAASATPRVDAHARAYAITCSQSGKKMRGAAGQTLLEAAESNGVEIPTLCRAGVCGTCRTRVTDGDVDCGSTTLDADDRRGGYVLACVATPLGDCTVEL